MGFCYGRKRNSKMWPSDRFSGPSDGASAGPYTDCNHGQGLAAIHPAYYRHILQDAPEKFTRLARVVFGVDTAEAGIEALENLIRECGLPTKLSRLKSTVEILPEVLRQVADTCNLIKSGPRELSKDEIYEILMECI